MKQSKRRNIAVGVALAAMMAGTAGQAADPGDVDDPIKLVILEWTGAHVTTHVAGQLLEKLGYTVEYVTAGNYPQFTGLADGDLSASLEIWMNNVGEIFPKALEAGDIEDLGSLGLETNEGWIYPTFMEEICPGLPDWEALNEPDCVAALATPETMPNGRFLDYPADWGSRAATILADNNMPYEAIPSGSEGALVAELESAEAAQTPLIMMFWGPHYALAENDVQWVNMPPCVEETEEHCITPPDVNKIVWTGFGDKWPAAYTFLQEFQMDTASQEAMLLAVEKNGEDLREVVAAWIAANEDVWTPWIEAARN